MGAGMGAGMQGGMPAGMGAGMQGGMPGGAAPGEGGGARRQFGAGGPGGQGGANMMAALTANLAPDQQKKARDIITKALGGKQMQDLAGDERRAAMTKIREEFQKAGLPVNMGGRGGPGGPGGQDGGAPRMPSMFNIGGFMYSQKDLDNAKLPPPPDEDSELDVLLRPGLLADVEIIVEKVPNAINVPIQAVFEKEGKQVVYVRNGNRFEARPIKAIKRSENVMIIAEGVKPGEVIAMANPEAKPGDKKKGDQKGSGGGGAASALPGGKGGM